MSLKIVFEANVFGKNICLETFKGTDVVPEVGDVITSSKGNGYLRRVKQVTTKAGQVHVETEPARLNEVFDDLELSTTVKIKPVNQATQAVARSSRSMMRMRNINSQQQITWDKSGFSLITDVSPTRGTKTLDVEGKFQVKEGSHAKLKAPASLSAKVGDNLQFDVTVANDWEVCKIKLEKIEHKNSELKNLANPEVGEAIITDAKQKGKVKVSWTPEKKHIDTEGRPYSLVFAAYIDDKGDNCNGDSWSWDEILDVEVPIYINYGEEKAQPNLEEKPLTFEGDFKVTNKTTFEFAPELNIEAKIKRSSLQSAQIKARAEGEVTGKMKLQKRLEINFLDSSFGMEYQRDRNQKWQVIKNFEPNYKFELKGDADAKASITLTLIPDLKISFYDAASGQMLVEPYTYAEADLHGQFRYLSDNNTSGYDLDYWFNKLEAGGGLNVKLFASLDIFGINLMRYPDADYLDKPENKFAIFCPIKKTPLWALPTLEAKMDISKALPDDSRSLLITGLATDSPFPFGERKSLNPFRNWATPKVLDQDSETVVNSSIALLEANTQTDVGNYSENLEETCKMSLFKETYFCKLLKKTDAKKFSGVFGNYWLRYTKSGKYRLRLGGFSKGGRWLRQKVDIDIDLSDQDNDGMPDLWEKQYGVSDPQQDDDKDGFNNLQFQQGTYPNNNSSCGSNSNSSFCDRLKDGGYGPEMVVIPAGTFRMGDIQGGGRDNEQPVHEVSVGQFAMGKYEVTFAEYDKFAEATGRDKPNDRGWGRGNRPVINVSWNDATAYTKWLSDQTSDVGSFAANQFGLYDTSGNVWEWTCSEYEEKYNGKEKQCVTTVSSLPVHGGSWSSMPRTVRSATRYWNAPSPRDSGTSLGFRVSRL